MIVLPKDSKLLKQSGCDVWPYPICSLAWKGGRELFNRLPTPAR